MKPKEKSENKKKIEEFLYYEENIENTEDNYLKLKEISENLLEEIRVKINLNVNFIR